MEDKIIKLFLFNKELKFSEIESLLKTRSNKLSYHIKNLISKGILEKKDNLYYLSRSSEALIPYLSDKKSVIVTLLILIGDKNKAFLYERKKRPFKNYLALPGGRLMVGESIEVAAKRIMKEKFNLQIYSIKTKSISHEHVKQKRSLVHSFMPILVSVKTKNKANLVNIEENKKKIIKSDYQLLKNNSSSKIRINTIYSRD